nr:GlsB/YeaQ/YmgE family stress response membrane protein [Nakamurella flavida]
MAGWVSSLIVRDPRPRGCLANIATGIIGAVLAGLVYQLSTGRSWQFRWDWPSFGVAVLGALALSLVVSLVGRSGRNGRRNIRR